MKKLLPILLFFYCISLKSQVVFCPPGAEWHYYFLWFNGGKINEHVKYSGDSLDGADTLKILSHKRLFLGCSPLMSKTLIKQKGDTILFKNSQTQNSWQTLYNFAATPGQSWTTTLLNGNTVTVTYTCTVDSAKQVFVNGFSLKRLYLKEKAIFANPSFTWNVSLSVTERLGTEGFLFHFRHYTSGYCDADYFAERLCYKDDAFGLQQFTDKACDYADLTGISEDHLSSLNIYPNPAKDLLTIEMYFTEGTEVRISDVAGRRMKTILAGQNPGINVSDLCKGIYFVSIFKDSEKIYTAKFVKE